jgi:hypothetical protein
MQHRETHHGSVFPGAQNEADCGIVFRSPPLLVIHTHIHVHLADILMGQLSGFQIEEHEALEQVVVKDQVKVKILRLRADPLLASDEGESFAVTAKAGRGSNSIRDAVRHNSGMPDRIDAYSEVHIFGTDGGLV